MTMNRNYRWTSFYSVLFIKLCLKFASKRIGICYFGVVTSSYTKHNFKSYAVFTCTDVIANAKQKKKEREWELHDG